MRLRRAENPHYGGIEFLILLIWMYYGGMEATHPPSAAPSPVRSAGHETALLDVCDWTAGPIRVGFRLCHGRFQGIAAVTHDGTPLRSPARPMFVEVRSPDGARLTDYRLVGRSTQGSELVLDLRPSRTTDPGAAMEWMNHEVKPRVATCDWTAEPEPMPDTRLRLELAPAARELRAHRASGFRYRYRFDSRTLAIYKLLDRGTWEPGGRALGSSIWMRGCGQPIAGIADHQQSFSTEWYLPGAANPNVYQFFPLQTHFQGFTFTATEHGVLVTWATEPVHIRTLIQKPADTDEIEHWHEHCGDLTHQLSTAAMEVLFIPGDFDRVELINIYEAVRDLVWAVLHEAAGIRPERVKTFGYIEEWGPADLDNYRRRGLPKLRDAGVRRIGLANHFQNNMNVLGVSNMCCTLDLKVADSAGADRLAAFCCDAREAGIEVEMWGNTALSALGLQLSRTQGKDGGPHPAVAGAHQGYAELAGAADPWVRCPNGGIDADHYSPVFVTLNLRDDTVRRWWLERWNSARGQIGLSGIFLDSSFNLSSDKFHYRPNNTPGSCPGGTIDQADMLSQQRPAREPPAAILSQYSAHLRLIRDMQAIGYSYSGEDNGVFGVSRCGGTDAGRLHSLFLWTDSIGHFDVPTIRHAGLDPDEVFFRGLAYRMVWMINWDPQADRLSFHQPRWRDEYDTPAEHHLRLIRAYRDIERHMRHRTVLRDERGVFYEDHGVRVLWACGSMSLDLGGPFWVNDVLNDERAISDHVHAAQRGVYLIHPLSDIRGGVPAEHATGIVP